MQYQQLLQEEELLLQQLSNIRKQKQTLRFKEELQVSINNIDINIKNAKKERKQLETKLSELDDYLRQQNKEKHVLLRKLGEVEEVEEVEVVEEVEEVEEQTDAEFLEEFKNNVLQIQEDLINQNIIYGPDQKPMMEYMKMTNSKTGGYNGSVQVGKYIADNYLPPEVYQRYLQIYKAHDNSHKSGANYNLGSYKTYLTMFFNELIEKM
jgi:hypothetical protein